MNVFLNFFSGTFTLCDVYGAAVRLQDATRGMIVVRCKRAFNPLKPTVATWVQL